MVRSSLPMNRLEYPSSHGGEKDLVHMHVHEFEGAMFEDEIEYDVHYMGRWTVCE